MKFKLLATSCAFALAAGGANAITVTTNSNANDLANTLLGSGVTIVSASYAGDDNASGTFVDGDSSGIGIDTGIILTTGSASSAPGPNSDPGITTAYGTPGITDGGGNGSFDAALLEITFTTDTGDLFFDYVFASEEYNEFVDGGVSDSFFFLLNGSDPLADNIALIPGTNTPVEIDTINLGDNASLFNDNEGGTFDIEYDGFTDVFTAIATGLAIGVEHTISMFIEDTGDDLLDSAVFLAGGTFSSQDPDPDPVNPIPLPAALPMLLAGLGGLGVLRSRRKNS